MLATLSFAIFTPINSNPFFRSMKPPWISYEILTYLRDYDEWGGGEFTSREVVIWVVRTCVGAGSS
jgi:hypothetical protein